MQCRGIVYAVKHVPRPRSLTPPQIADAALAVIERDGLAALSMRAVASALGVGTMSLYRYVASREALEALVVGRVFAGVDLRPPRTGPWTRRVAGQLQHLRGVLSSHPQLLPLMVLRGPSAPHLMTWLEGLLALLAEAGFTPDARVIAARTLGSYAIGAVQLEQLGPARGRAAELAGAPRAAFPLLRETAARARRLTADEEFQRGVAAVLRGLDPSERLPRRPR